MEVEKKFKENFLTHRKNKKGKTTSFLVLGICFVMSQFYWDKSYEISKFLSASKDLVFVNGEYWRLFTTSFVHGDIGHLLSNSLMLFILTYFVTSFYGLFVSVILSFTMGMVTNYFVISQYDVNTTLVGASGIVYYLWGFWMMLYICIEKQTSLIKRFIRVGGVFLILLIPTTYSPTTSYLAHYIGYALGMVIGFIYYFLNYKNISQYEKWDYRIVPSFEEEEPESEVANVDPNESNSDYLH